MTKIWLINAIEKNPKSYIDMKYNGLGLAYISSYIKKYGNFNNVTITENGKFLSSKLINKINPDIVGVSSITQNFNIAKEITSKIKKEKDIPVIVGGYHISALPNNLTENMNVAVIGEGEQTFLELLFSYEKNGLTKNKLSVINGLAYWDGGRFIITPKRKLINPLNKIPFPDRKLLNNLSGDFYMFTSRGCPYSCSFCSSTAFWKKIRFFSAKYVVNEIKELISNFKVDSICFYDDLFIANKKRVKDIGQLLKKEKIKIRFSCSVRANLINNKMALLLKDINITKISLGIESGSKKILKYLKGDSVTVEQNFNAVNVLKKYGFIVGASFIIGSPHETEKDIIKTLNFIKKSKLDVGETYILTPFPNTKIWDYCKKNGIVTDFMNWDNIKMYFNSNINRVVITDKISKERLLYFDRLFKKEWKKRYIKYLLSRAIKNPKEITPYIRKTINRKLIKMELK